MKKLIIFVMAILSLSGCSQLDAYDKNMPIEHVETIDKVNSYAEPEQMIAIFDEEMVIEDILAIIQSEEIVSCWNEDYGRYIHTSIENWICNKCHEVISPRYGFTENDIYLLAQLLCGDKNKDGDGEYDFTWNIQNDRPIDYHQIGLVLCVVMNRVRSDSFPNTVKDVILQSGQFSVFPQNLKSDPDPLVIQEIRNWCEVYDIWNTTIQCIPENHLYFSSGPNLTNISRANWKE